MWKGRREKGAPLPEGAPKASGGQRPEWLIFAAFVGPNMVLFAAFTYWPIFYSAYLSLVDWQLPGTNVTFTGLGNYVALFHDPWFWKVLLNTVVYAVVVVFSAQILAFGLALMLNQKVMGRALFRTLAFMPHITTPAAAALVWVLLLDPSLGPLSFVYHLLGTDGPRWLAHGSLALWAIILVGTWKEIGFASIFFLAGLQTVPVQVYEAARLDGASPWATLRYVTAPLLSPVVFFLLVSGFISAVKVFDFVAIMTAGGPVYPDSSTYVYHLYHTGFRQYRMGYASALAVVFFAVMLSVTVVQIRLSNRWVYREGDVS